MDGTAAPAPAAATFKARAGGKGSYRKRTAAEAASGKVQPLIIKAPTWDKAIRNDAKSLRSFGSSVITPDKAEYGLIRSVGA